MGKVRYVCGDFSTTLYVLSDETTHPQYSDRSSL